MTEGTHKIVDNDLTSYYDKRKQYRDDLKELKKVLEEKFIGKVVQVAKDETAPKFTKYGDCYGEDIKVKEFRIVGDLFELVGYARTKAGPFGGLTRVKPLIPGYTIWLTPRED